MTTPVEKAVTEVCSTLEYLVDQQELDPDGIVDVLTRVRYTDIVVSHFDVVHSGRVLRFTAQDIGEAPKTDDEEDWEPEEGCPKCGRVVGSTTVEGREWYACNDCGPITAKPIEVKLHKVSDLFGGQNG